MSRKFTLTFDMGNAAFDDGGAPQECARILRKVADHVGRGEDGGTIRDYNGNRIGEWSADISED